MSKQEAWNHYSQASHAIMSMVSGWRHTQKISAGASDSGMASGPARSMAVIGTSCVSNFEITAAEGCWVVARIGAFISELC